MKKILHPNEKNSLYQNDISLIKEFLCSCLYKIKPYLKAKCVIPFNRYLVEWGR